LLLINNNDVEDDDERDVGGDGDNDCVRLVVFIDGIKDFNDC
jgi:hypothetical protein